MPRGNIGFELSEGLFTDVRVADMVGDETWTEVSPVVQSINPDGAARAVTLPPAASTKRRLFLVANTADAAEIITIQDATPTTIATPTQAECAIVWSDGTNWHAIVGPSS